MIIFDSNVHNYQPFNFFKVIQTHQSEHGFKEGVAFR
jgi:hypothetical protein